MHALHGGDDAEASKAWDIIGVPVLDVLDAPASIGRRPIGPDRFIQVEGLAVGAMAPPNECNSPDSRCVDGVSACD